MRRYTVRINDAEHTLDVEETARDRFVVHFGDRLVDVTLVDHEDLAQARIAPAVEIGTPRALPDTIPAAGATPVAEVRRSRSLEAPDDPSRRTRETRGSAAPRDVLTSEARNRLGPAGRPQGSSGRAGRDAVTAPMPGVVLSVEVAPGAVVTRGQLLLVLEAMKMKNDIRAERDGVIASVSAAPGDQVKHGDPMIAYEG